MFELVIILSIFILSLALSSMLVMFGYASILVARGAAESKVTQTNHEQDLHNENEVLNLTSRLNDLRLETFRMKKYGK